MDSKLLNVLTQTKYRLVWRWQEENTTYGQKYVPVSTISTSTTTRKWVTYFCGNSIFRSMSVSLCLFVSESLGTCKEPNIVKESRDVQCSPIVQICSIKWDCYSWKDKGTSAIGASSIHVLWVKRYNHSSRFNMFCFYFSITFIRTRVRKMDCDKY